MKRTDKEIEDQVVYEYTVNSLGVKSIGEKLGINSVTAFNILKRRGIELRSKGGYPKDKFNKAQIIEDYKNGVRVTEIAKQYGVRIETIYYFMKRLGVPRDYIYHNKDLNREYFKNIDTYDKAYFLGFMLTDGCVTDDNDVRLSLKQSDSYILDKFNEKINNSNSVKFIERTDGRKEASFHFKSRKVQDDLISHNVIPRKSLVVKFPLLDDWRMMSHMIRGIIDGNGSISYKAHSISLCSASLEFIVHFTYYMETVLGLSKRKIRVRHDPTGYYSDVYTVSWSSKQDVYKIGRYIYLGKNDCYLERKWQNWLKIIIQDNTEVT